jgi:hypothetical protein
LFYAILHFLTEQNVFVKQHCESYKNATHTSVVCAQTLGFGKSAAEVGCGGVHHRQLLVCFELSQANPIFVI